MTPRAVEARVAALQAQTRSLSSTLILVIAAALFALAPLIPGVSAILGVDVTHTSLAMIVFCTSTLVATATYHLTGMSRIYWRTEAAESVCVVASLLYLVYASGSAVSIFWLFVAIHGFFCAVTDPWPRRHQIFIYVAGPALLGGAFWLLRHDAASAAVSMLLGASLVWFLTVLIRTTRRVALLLDEKEALARDLAALRVLEERRRIARDLHDSLGADLTSALWQARALASSQGPEAARAEALSQRVATSISELRSIVHLMRDRPVSFREFCEDLAERCRALSRLPLQFTARASGGDPLLDGFIASEARRATLEMVRNADRHAAPTTITVSVYVDRELTIVVEDDGRGLSEEALEESPGGLQNLRERAHLLHGALTMTALHPGTRLTFAVPIPDRRMPMNMG